MNKLLVLICVLVSVKSVAMDLATNQVFNTAKQRTTDPRPLVNQIQLALLESVGGVFETLKIAEGSYPDYSAFDSSTANKYSGLINISVINNVITFSFNPTEINPNLAISPFQLIYDPIISQTSITGWDCSVANLSSLGSDFIIPSEGSHPLTLGLGWPYEECIVAS
ncbi:MAG: hypothetical protein FJX18_06810 [Alphaproteobacteria bacterium]|nr:hypothetical protein [Alphaproteobacteria bacterium]